MPVISDGSKSVSEIIESKCNDTYLLCFSDVMLLIMFYANVIDHNILTQNDIHHMTKAMCRNPSP